MENTQEDRIALIKEAYLNSKTIAPKQSVKNLVEEVKSEEFFSEHGLLDNKKEDLEDESQFLNSDSAEDIDEEDQEMGLSEEMRESIGITIKRDDQLEFDKDAMLWVGSDIKNRPKTDKDWVFYKSGTGS